MRPTVHLLCGLPGSGKTSYAKKLETQGVARFTLDEELFKRFGREYESHETKLQQTKKELQEIIKEKVRAGESVCIDFGFWKKSDRDQYKEFIASMNAECVLLYFKVNKQTLLERLTTRNVTDPTQNHIIDEPMLEKFISEFEEPKNENEITMK